MKLSEIYPGKLLLSYYLCSFLISRGLKALVTEDLPANVLTKQLSTLAFGFW